VPEMSTGSVSWLISWQGPMPPILSIARLELGRAG